MKHIREGARFYAVHYQDGGCDYTIGCGLCVVALKAQTRDEAEQEVARDLGDNEGDRAREEVLIIEAVQSWPFDIVAHTERMRQAQRDIENQAREAEEREEYERLRRKFDKMQG